MAFGDQDASGPVFVKTNTAGKAASTGSFTPPTGALLIAFAWHDTAGGNLTNTSLVTDSLGLVWNVQVVGVTAVGKDLALVWYTRTKVGDEATKKVFGVLPTVDDGSLQNSRTSKATPGSRAITLIVSPPERALSGWRGSLGSDTGSRKCQVGLSGLG